MKKDKNKGKNYVCVICGKGTKAKKKVKCCGKNMLSKQKGTWLE